MEFNKDILNKNWAKLEQEKIIVGSSLDNIQNTELGDYWIFVVTILDNEKGNKNYFTTGWDRDRDLPILFRQSYYDYLNSGVMYSYEEYIEEWLKAYDEESKKQQFIQVTEVCPNCGREITISVSKDTEYLKFCPFCGEQDVYLCSECIDKYGDCNTKIGFCKDKCHL